MIYKGQYWHDCIAMNALHMLFVNCNMLLNDTDLILLNINPCNWNDLSNALCWFILKDELFILTIYGYVSIASTELGHRMKGE